MKNKKDSLKEKIGKDEDFIYCPRLSNSLKKFIEKHPDGVSEDRICKVLLMEKEELDKIFNTAIKKIRDYMGLKGEEE